MQADTLKEVKLYVQNAAGFFVEAVQERCVKKIVLHHVIISLNYGKITFIMRTVSRINNRGRTLRLRALTGRHTGEESPGFTGQDAG